jgi:hypothetical protein
VYEICDRSYDIRRGFSTDCAESMSDGELNDRGSWIDRDEVNGISHAAIGKYLAEPSSEKVIRKVIVPGGGVM